MDKILVKLDDVEIFIKKINYPSRLLITLYANERFLMDGMNGKSYKFSIKFPAKSRVTRLGNKQSSGKFTDRNSLEERLREVIDITLFSPFRFFNLLQCRFTEADSRNNLILSSGISSID
jgi:hypothetical protein